MLQDSRRTKCRSFKGSGTWQVSAYALPPFVFYQWQILQPRSGHEGRFLYALKSCLTVEQRSDAERESAMQEQIININTHRYDKFDLRTRRGRAAFVAAIWDRAIDVIYKTGRASVAHFQRQLCIGYGSAVDLINEMENRGVIGPKRQGWPTREVLIQTRTTKLN